MNDTVVVFHPVDKRGTDDRPPLQNQPSGASYNSCNRSESSSSNGGSDGPTPVVPHEVPPPPAQPPVVNSLLHRNVYISGLPNTFRTANFRKMCQRFGTIEASKLCNVSEGSKGFGFVLFVNKTSAMLCISELNGLSINGCLLQARYADASATPPPMAPADPSKLPACITRPMPSYKPGCPTPPPVTYQPPHHQQQLHPMAMAAPHQRMALTAAHQPQMVFMAQAPDMAPPPAAMGPSFYMPINGQLYACQAFQQPPPTMCFLASADGNQQQHQQQRGAYFPVHFLPNAAGQVGPQPGCMAPGMAPPSSYQQVPYRMMT